MVGMVSSPCSASVLVEVTALLVFVTPEHTMFVFNSLMSSMHVRVQKSVLG